MYQQTRLSDTSAIGIPGPLPDVIATWGDAPDLLADLTGRVDPQFGFDGTGFWPVVATTPSFDASKRILAGTVTLGAADPNAKTWSATADLRDLTPAEIAAAQATLVAYANTKQWALATGGYTTTVAGVSITFPSDVGSLSLIAGTAQTLQQPSGPASTNWQAGPSTIVQIKAADFIPAALKVSAFVDATFGALAPIFAGIGSGQITTAAEIDAASWPANAG